MINSYGLTETTIDSTFFEGTPVNLDADRSAVPIGRPIPGTRSHILDERYEPAPIGVVGELYIGGSGGARGYADDPRQTAERYVPDPYGEPGSRLYATGDRARWQQGGVLELVGRKDRQVKVHGFRVELAEIEAAIGSYPGVREAAVISRMDGVEGTRLIACVVGDRDQSLCAARSDDSSAIGFLVP